MRGTCLALIALPSLATSGCGTVITQTDACFVKREEQRWYGPDLYSGLLADLWLLDVAWGDRPSDEIGVALMAPVLAPLTVLDVPLSLALDTALLPVTAVRQLFFNRTDRLIARLASEHSEERRRAANFLRKCWPRAARAIPALERTLEDADPGVREAARDTLEILRDE